MSVESKNSHKQNFLTCKCTRCKALSLQILTGNAHKSFCNTDKDCEWFRDSATGDQNLVCIKETASDKHGLCECDKGYVYHTEAEMCVDSKCFAAIQLLLQYYHYYLLLYILKLYTVLKM